VTWLLGRVTWLRGRMTWPRGRVTRLRGRMTWPRGRVTWLRGRMTCPRRQMGWSVMRARRNIAKIACIIRHFVANHASLDFIDPAAGHPVALRTGT
jgi:hypothetical protein